MIIKYPKKKKEWRVARGMVSAWVNWKMCIKIWHINYYGWKERIE